MHVGGQCEDGSYLGYVGFLVQHSLIEMGGGPAQRDIEIQRFREGICRRGGICVSPGLEGSYLTVFLVQSDITVHHGADADGTESLGTNAVFFLYFLTQVRVAGLQALFRVREGIGPDAVNEGVFPLIGTGGQNIAVMSSAHP